jgi:DNA-binding transcriptional LysR family regulator
MDRFDAMRVFTRVVERRSFTLAAEDLGLPRSTVTDAVKQLEARLSVRLPQRTTRHVSPTLDGEAYHRRCLALIADLEDAKAAFGGAKPKGLLRIDVHGTLARHFLLPRLRDFLSEYPGIELYMSEGERLVDLVREGIDCVLRAGNLDPLALLKAAEHLGLEGIVSKRRKAPYRSGPSRDWIKTKTSAWRQSNQERWRRFETTFCS